MNSSTFIQVDTILEAILWFEKHEHFGNITLVKINPYYTELSSDDCELPLRIYVANGHEEDIIEEIFLEDKKDNDTFELQKPLETLEKSSVF